MRRNRAMPRKSPSPRPLAWSRADQHRARRNFAHPAVAVAWTCRRGLLALARRAISAVLEIRASMTLRAVLVASLAVGGSAVVRCPAASLLAPAKAATAPMVFYVVKGAPDACGRGCDSWIAAEGQIDSGAAARFRKFLARRRATAICRSISPRPAAISNRRWRWGHAARTVRDRPGGANRGEGLRLRSAGRRGLPQAEAVRPRIRRRSLDPRREVQFRLSLSHTGRDHREIAPDAMLAVHSPKVVLHSSGGSRPARCARRRRSAVAARRPHAGDLYLKMGAKPALLDACEHHQVRGCTC